MGYYIETPGYVYDKALGLKNLYQGQIIEKPPSSFSDIPEDKALIVVVSNPMFDAAGLVFNQQEFEVFTKTTRNDRRHRIFVLLDKKLAHKLSGYEEVISETS